MVALSLKHILHIFFFFKSNKSKLPLKTKRNSRKPGVAEEEVLKYQLFLKSIFSCISIRVGSFFKVYFAHLLF